MLAKHHAPGLDLAVTAYQDGEEESQGVYRAVLHEQRRSCHGPVW
jgi:hypothetical protein